MAHGFLRYIFRKWMKNKVCYTCGKLFEEGDEIVRTRSNGYQRRHSECYVDGRGEIILG